MPLRILSVEALACTVNVSLSTPVTFLASPKLITTFETLSPASVTSEYTLPTYVTLVAASVGV